MSEMYPPELSTLKLLLTVIARLQHVSKCWYGSRLLEVSDRTLNRHGTEVHSQRSE
jgi:hypothetical protein